MAQRLKRWESPRRKGRNHKGKGGSARHRQVIKQQKLWQKRLKQQPQSQPQSNNSKSGEVIQTSPDFL